MRKNNKKSVQLRCNVCCELIPVESEYRHFDWCDVDICLDCWEDDIDKEKLFDMLNGEVCETGSDDWLEEMIYGMRGALTR